METELPKVKSNPMEGQPAKPEGVASGFREGPIGWIVFDNPARRNAMSSAMAVQALVLVGDYARDPAVKVVVLRGAGDRAFVSGSDISKFKETRIDAAPGSNPRQATDDLKQALVALDKPVIAMMHGYCLGGGVSLALCADLRFASDDCQIGIPVAQRGSTYPPDGLRRLMALVGPSIAKDMLFSGRRLPADEALRIGLVNRVFPAHALEAETVAYAELLAKSAPLSIRASKICIDAIGRDPDDQDEALMQQVQDDAAASADFREATIAFMEKRKPVFQGR